MRTALYVLFGYLSGSVLYARVSACCTGRRRSAARRIRIPGRSTPSPWEASGAA